MKKMKPVLLAFFCLGLVGSLSNESVAANIAVFQTTGVDAGTDTSVAASSVDPGATVSDLALNTPNVVPLGSAWGGALSVGNVNGAGNDDLDDAINGDGTIFDGSGTDGGDYVSVTVAPQAGNQIDFTNFHLNIASNVQTALGPQNIDLLSSLTGFTAADSLGTFNPANPGGFANSSHDFAISDPALAGVTGSVEFRLYFSNIGNRISIGNVFNGGAVTDDVVISGTVTAVPEPSTIGLLVLGSLAIAGIRKRS